ncbi:DivIVA domain-containing protein [Mumia flava]|uniref:Cell wall synthesis protein Wag31 n=1 Tax=Mumia flava TaxID=1348852 RepID=A0A0B2BRC9_9ACTN|nr:DivIVA domain-containing protein [Mumia flava]PJJ57597.1 DivIVA domain-containing protein [Mumia flava]
MTSTDVSKIAAEIRRATFTIRRRGFDEDEVLDYLAQLAESVQHLEDDNASLRRELDAKRAELEEKAEAGTEISAQAVIMFAEAQKVADSLIDEAVQHARDLMMSARTQQRDIVKEAHAAAEEAASKAEAAATRLPATTDGAAPVERTEGGAVYDHPVPEIEYVRTFAKVAQIQLRSVLEALTEQVDALGEMPDLRRDDRRGDDR